MNTGGPAIIDQADLDWDGWHESDPTARNAIRWKILITGEHTESSGLITGIAEILPGARLALHHHEPEETYYIISGHGRMEVEDHARTVGPGCAIHIPANARHALQCTGAEPLVFVFSFAWDRFDRITYHFHE